MTTFACFLCSRGYVVAGHDQIGHRGLLRPRRVGLHSAARWFGLPHRRRGRGVEDRLGARGRREPRASSSVTPWEDSSSGCRIARHGEGLAGAVIGGTGHLPPAKGGCRQGTVLRSLGSSVGGPQVEVRRRHGRGCHAKAIPIAGRTLTGSPSTRTNVRRYIDDPACGFMFSVEGMPPWGPSRARHCRPETSAKVPT